MVKIVSVEAIRRAEIETAKQIFKELENEKICLETEDECLKIEKFAFQKIKAKFLQERTP